MQQALKECRKTAQSLKWKNSDVAKDHHILQARLAYQEKQFTGLLKFLQASILSV